MSVHEIIAQELFQKLEKKYRQFEWILVYYSLIVCTFTASHNERAAGRQVLTISFGYDDILLNNRIFGFEDNDRFDYHDPELFDKIYKRVAEIIEEIK